MAMKVPRLRAITSSLSLKISAMLMCWRPWTLISRPSTRRALCRGTGLRFLGEPRFQFVFAHLQQAAVGVVDDDELLRVEQVMRDNQRPQGIFGGDAAGVADHVRVSGMQTQAVLKQDAGIHAS